MCRLVDSRISVPWFYEPPATYRCLNLYTPSPYIKARAASWRVLVRLEKRRRARLSGLVEMVPRFVRGIHMHHHSRQKLEMLSKLGIHFFCNRMPSSDAKRGVDRDVDLRVETMADPPCADITYTLDPVHMGGRVSYLIRSLRLDSIEHSREHELYRLPDYTKNRDGDEKAYNWIGFRISEVNAQRANEDGQARPPIGSRVIAVCNERCASDLPADPNSENSHAFVTQETDDGRHHDREHVSHGMRMQQSLDRLVKSHCRAGEDCEHHGETGKIFHPPKPVIELGCWLSPGEEESDAQGNGSCGVAEIVDRVGEQRHASGQKHYRQLYRSGDEKPGESPFDGPYPFVSSGERGIHYPVRVAVTSMTARMASMTGVSRLSIVVRMLLIS